MYALGIDLGTTYTAAAVWRDGRVEIASLGSRVAAIPSVVLLREDDTVLTGETANRRAVSEPHRVAREFKRRIGDSTPILLGGVPQSAEQLTARLLRAVVAEVSAREGGPPAAICLSHPANWGPFKIDLMQQAVRIAGLTAPVTLLTEPEAAAVSYAHQQRVEPGSLIAVYDLGGGTFDAAVLRTSGTGFVILGRPEGIERLGGIDFDAAVFGHVAAALSGKLEELDEDDPAAVAAVAKLRQECSEAKEALSSDTDVTIPVFLPNVVTEVRLTRAELEAMVRPALSDSIEALKRAIDSAGVSAADLQAVLLVGGSSRIPLVAQLVAAELGRPVAVDAHPKNAIALGAAWVAGDTLVPQTAPAVPAAEPTPATPVPAAEPTPATPVPAQETQAIPASSDVTANTPAGGPAGGPPPTPPSWESLAPSGGHAPPTATDGRRTRVLAGAIAAVLVLAAGGIGIAWAMNRGNGTGTVLTTGPTTTPEQAATASPTPSPTSDATGNECTSDITANKRWVCLTGAKFDGQTLTIDYTADFAGSTPDVSGGFHLHIYGSDGTRPPEERMGTQSDNPGSWYIEDKNPSVRTVSSRDYQRAIKDAPQVCARIANSKHQLVPDDSGGFHTGNCIPIER